MWNALFIFIAKIINSLRNGKRISFPKSDLTPEEFREVYNQSKEMAERANNMLRYI